MKKYTFIRIPQETYKKYFDLKVKWETDIKTLTGKSIKLTMPKVFNGVINPNLIKSDLNNLFKEKKNV